MAKQFLFLCTLGAASSFEAQGCATCPGSPTHPKKTRCFSPAARAPVCYQTLYYCGMVRCIHRNLLRPHTPTRRGATSPAHTVGVYPSLLQGMQMAFAVLHGLLATLAYWCNSSAEQFHQTAGYPAHLYLFLRSHSPHDCVDTNRRQIHPQLCLCCAFNFKVRTRHMTQTRLHIRSVPIISRCLSPMPLRQQQVNALCRAASTSHRRAAACAPPMPLHFSQPPWSDQAYTTRPRVAQPRTWRAW